MVTFQSNFASLVTKVNTMFNFSFFQENPFIMKKRILDNKEWMMWHCSFTSDGSNTILSNIDQTRTSNKLERVHLLVIELEHPIFGFERTNIEPNRAFTKFTKLLIELTRTSFFRTLNELERVHLLEIELEHPILAFERSNFEHSSTQHYLLQKKRIFLERTTISICIFTFFYVYLKFWCQSVAISGFFYHSDFTWNQF